MNWLFWSPLSAMFAGLTAVLAKVRVNGTDLNLATAVRTSVVLIGSGTVVLALKYARGHSQFELF